MENIKKLYTAAVSLKAAQSLIPGNYTTIVYRDILTELRKAMGVPHYAGDNVITQAGHFGIFTNNRLLAVAAIKASRKVGLAEAVEAVDTYTLRVAARMVAESELY